MHYLEYLFANLNYLAVFVAALANFFIGALWFSPVLFAKPWMKEVFNTTDQKEIKKNTNMALTMGMAFVMTLMTAFGLALLVSLPDDSIMLEQRLYWGLGVAAIISVLIVSANTYKHYQFEQRTFKLALINGAHDIVCFMTMAVILVYWR